MGKNEIVQWNQYQNEHWWQSKTFDMIKKQEDNKQNKKLIDIKFVPAINPREVIVPIARLMLYSLYGRGATPLDNNIIKLLMEELKRRASNE